MILIHGMAASMYDWNSLAPELVRNGYQAITLDLLGHGDSPKPRDPDLYSFENIKEQISQWISSLELTPPLWLIGHSLGGLLCLTYGSEHQNEVRGMVLVDPFYRSNQLSPIIRMLNNRPEIWGKAMGLVPNWLINAFAGWEIKANHRISDSSRQQIAEDYRRASPHILEITKSVPNLDERLSEMVIFARKVAQLLKGIFYAEGLNLSLQDQEAAGQTLAHVHLHVVPRYKNDIPEPGDWYPKISSNYKEILDSQYRPKLDRNEMDMIVKRLREEAVKMELY